MAFLKKNCTFVKYLREMEIFFRFVKKKWEEICFRLSSFVTLWLRIYDKVRCQPERVGGMNRLT